MFGLQDLLLWLLIDLVLNIRLTEKTEEPSFTANWLENCKEPLANLIKEIREVNKFYSAFIDSIIKHAHKGRIHAEINQLRGTGGGYGYRSIILFFT
jgi:DNA polymerase I-like protein with 3'-5' exonuclease and polymerase domains